MTESKSPGSRFASVTDADVEELRRITSDRLAGLHVEKAEIWRRCQSGLETPRLDAGILGLYNDEIERITRLLDATQPC